MEDVKRSLIEQKQDLYEGGKLKGVSITITKKCNLGNFENFDLSLTYNLEKNTLEEERSAFDVVRATVKSQEERTKEFFKNGK